MKRNALIAIVLIATASILSAPTVGEEPCDRFLQALRDNGYYDVAIDYLDEMETNPLAPKRFKQTLPFEKAQTLIKSTVRIRDLAELEARLTEAEALLQRSESAASTPELKARSQNYQGDLLFRRAAIFLKRAEDSRLTAGEKAEQYSQARGYLKKALEIFGRAKASYKDLIDNFQLDLRDPESKQHRKHLQATYTVVRVKLPQILEKYADTLDPQDPERDKNLAAAAKDFEQLWLKYPNFPAGLDSCLYAGRCNYKLKKYDDAITFFQQIFALPNTTALMTLKRRAMVLAADSWSQMSPYPFDDVIANFEPFVARLNRRDQKQCDWQRVQLELAKAYHAKGTDLKASDPSDGRIKNFLRDAAKMIKTLARSPGDHRATARKYLAEWNLSIETNETETSSDSTPIRSFADARERGTELITDIEGLNADVSDLKRQQRAPGADVNKLQAEIDISRAKLRSLSAKCLDVLDRALKLADETTPPEDINQIRYLQSVCHFIYGFYYEASLIGEFLVDRYPNVAYSRQAGGIAVRGLAAQHDKSDPDKRSFERERLSHMATKIIDRWPGSNEAIEAAATLTKLILANPNLDEAGIGRAMKLIDSIPERSLERGALNVKLGTKLWFSYRRMAASDDADPDDVATRLAVATEYLSDGIKEFNSGNLRMEAAWGALFLVNAHLEAGNLDAAMNQLESANVAPIDLLKEKNDVIFDSGKSDLYIIETYKVAAKTYLAALTKQPEKGSVWTEKSLGVIRALNARAVRSGDAKAKQDVINMYRLVAVQLEKQLATIKEPTQQKQFVKNLNQFLQTLQSESEDSNTIIWAGKTLMSIGDSFSDQSMASEAKPLYTSAIAALDRAEKIGVDDERLRIELQRQQAIAKRAVGKYDESFNALLELLKNSPNAWHIQMDAAKTLQQWGTATKSKTPLAKALSGTEKYRDPKTKRTKNLVWGWSRLAQALKDNADLKEAYYKSLIGAVETRLEYGLIEGNRKVVEAALKRLNIAKTKDQNFGGAEWKARFDELEKRIKQQMESM